MFSSACVLQVHKFRSPVQEPAIEVDLSPPCSVSGCCWSCDELVWSAFLTLPWQLPKHTLCKTVKDIIILLVITLMCAKIPYLFCATEAAVAVRQQARGSCDLCYCARCVFTVLMSSAHCCPLCPHPGGSVGVIRAGLYPPRLQ